VRYAIVSDIHSNLEALEAVLGRCAPDDEVLCLGDIVGYGPNPNECLDLIRARASTCILGNHDVAAIDDHGLAYFNPMAREALKWTQSVLRADHLKWLDGLAYEVRMPGYLLVHGAPVDYFEYILDTETAAKAFAATDAPLVFIGHSHVAESYALGSDGQIVQRRRPRGGTLELEPGTRYLINVGSVGQPRDRNPEASFATYDPSARTVVWERVEYAIARVQAKIGEAQLPPALAERLSAGR
jgi:diadenosine tetraphosphatase ApaH/serine/threonine PP2A family protein phosphatase